KAEPLYQQSLAIPQKSLGPEHPAVATSLNNLAVLYHSHGLYAKAEPLYQQSLANRKKALGPEHPDVATSLNNLAELYRAQGLYAKAEPLYQQSLAIWKKALGPEHPDVATVLENYAKLLTSHSPATQLRNAPPPKANGPAVITRPFHAIGAAFAGQPGIHCMM
ncbi:MAG: tetratricopeptide repeat protein, partial [Burkholderiales bacterium]